MSVSQLSPSRDKSAGKQSQTASHPTFSAFYYCNMAETRDCLACRITGTATFTGVGIYALWMSREAAPGSRGSKKLVALFGAAMLVGGVLRWKQTEASAQPAVAKKLTE
ncbi:hypothetical protein B0H19DRAFT_299136 [Mycena capillaripes]|nr:hypothetical protein B0H19DRAFT_299136 [Mycena capillaripes]